MTIPKRRKIVRIVAKDDDESTLLFWKNKSPEERVSAVELLREQCYVIQGYKTVPSIIRKLRVVNR